jgi:copper chaperone
MEILQFKTNINCSGCTARVTPALNEAKGILSWKVDTGNTDKILTVETEGLSKESIADAVKKAGFTCTVLNSQK